MRQAFEGGWVDVYENEGKMDGAFSAGIYGTHPYMLLNYNETLSEVFTVAHEMGHTLHTMLAYENQPYSTADYTIFVAEVASTLNEALLLDYLLEKTDDPVERVALLTHAINSIVGTYYVQTMFADFELRAHRLVEDGQPITADVLREVYTELVLEQQGPDVTFDDQYGGTWTRISHFYHSPFYVYQYATCYASSSQIHAAITDDTKEERQAALERYLTLLKSGGSDYPMEQLKAAGVDLTDAGPFQAVVDYMDELVTRLGQELDRLES
jgi:oligoendopeptidase F